MAVRTNQVGNLIRLAILCLTKKLEWEIAMARLDGSYYAGQVEQATENYKDQHKEDFKCDTSKVEGFDRWRKESLK